ncbi:TetR/AcrR family transcriptional regulator [Streptomyces daliensis]|uniref:TetR/AcrR family transcriptional regulator n=1 Tax=Streptomyces daliensis TaxID=299421 RepID=A0A8T4IYB2_9ACTN|nr:TetR/AcrR family transcriptional regulator [Streptomyces daliensis]
MTDTAEPEVPVVRALTPGARKILDAAEELFYGRGITAVGVDLIAKEAGVTKKTLYDRFGSKDTLVAAYLRARDERWREWLTERVARSGPGAHARTLATFDALAEWMSERNPRGCGFVNAAAELPDPGHPGRKVIAEQKRWLRGLLRGLAEEAGARDPGLLADELALLHEGAMVLHGLAVVDDPVRVARSMAEPAMERAGCVR